MPATMKDIASDLGVSIVTVSKVLRNHSDISDATRKRVLKRVKELNYQPNWVALYANSVTQTVASRRDRSLPSACSCFSGPKSLGRQSPLRRQRIWERKPAEQRKETKLRASEG